MCLQAGWVGHSPPPLQRRLRWTASTMSWSTQRASASACESQRPSRWPQGTRWGLCHFSSPPCSFTQLWCRCQRGSSYQVKTVHFHTHKAVHGELKYRCTKVSTLFTFFMTPVPLYHQPFLFNCPSPQVMMGILNFLVRETWTWFSPSLPWTSWTWRPLRVFSL